MLLAVARLSVWDAGSSISSENTDYSMDSSNSFSSIYYTSALPCVFYLTIVSLNVGFLKALVFTGLDSGSFRSKLSPDPTLLVFS